MPGKSHAPQQSVQPELQPQAAPPQVEAPTSNAAENDRLGLASGGGVCPMEILGDIGLRLLGLPALIDLAKRWPQALPYVCQHDGRAIAQADPEFAWRLVDRVLAPQTGLAVGAELAGQFQGVPLTGQVDGELMRPSPEAFVDVEARRQGAIELGDEGTGLAFEVEHAVSTVVELDPAAVIDLVGVAALMGGTLPKNAVAGLVQMIDERAGAYHEHLEVRGVAKVDEDAELVDLQTEPGFLFGSVLGDALGQQQETLRAFAQVAAELGLEQRVHIGDDGAWQELEVHAGARIDAGIEGLSELADLPIALASFGVGAKATVRIGTELSADEPAFHVHEVRVEVSKMENGSEQADELVFSSLIDAVAALMDTSRVTTAKQALEASPLVALSRSVRVELADDDPRAPDVAQVVPELSLPGVGKVQKEFTIEASARVDAQAVAARLPHIELPGDMEPIDGAKCVLEALLDARRGQALPAWMPLGPEQVEALVEIEAPQLVGEVRMTVDVGTDELAGAEGQVARLIDAPYTGELHVDVWR